MLTMSCFFSLSCGHTLNTAPPFVEMRRRWFRDYGMQYQVSAPLASQESTVLKNRTLPPTVLQTPDIWLRSRVGPALMHCVDHALAFSCATYIRTFSKM